MNLILLILWLILSLLKTHQVLSVFDKNVNIPKAFTGNTIYALHDILKQNESLNPSDLVHDFELPDLPSPESPKRHSASPLSLASLPADLQQLLTPSNSHQSMFCIIY